MEVKKGNNTISKLLDHSAGCPGLVNVALYGQFFLTHRNLETTLGGEG